MAVKNYLINDKWLDIDKQNIVEVKSTDGVIGSIKLNGEEYGGSGGGGESDFSTAQVTVQVTGNVSNSIIFKNLVTITEDSEGRHIVAKANFGVSSDNTPQQFTVILLDGDYGNLINYTGNISVSGSAELLEGFILIHGDCTITIS